MNHHIFKIGIYTSVLFVFSIVLNAQEMKYPTTKKVNQTDQYFGTEVSDPYRWLEDDRSQETADWVKEQNKVTNAYLDKIPYRAKIKDEMTKLWNYEKYSAPFVRGKYTYFYKNDGLQQHSVLYRQKEGGEAEVFLDPNQFSEDGTTSLAGVSFTKDGSRVAYSISEGGSDWRKVIVMDTETKKPIGDSIRDVKFSGISWKGNNGFYYSSYDKPKGESELSAKTSQHKLFFHQLNTPQSSDQLIFGGEKTPRRYIGGYLTEDERFLVITASVSTTNNELYIQDLSKQNSEIIPIVEGFDMECYVVDNRGDELLIHTNYNAPNNRLVRTNLANPTKENWSDIIPETKNVLNVSKAGGYIFAHYIVDVLDKIQQYDYDGNKVREIQLPSVGSASGFSGKKDQTKIYYGFTNYIYPYTLFSYDVNTGESKLYKKPDIDFNPEDYVSEQIFYKSKDGTKVPMIITHKKGIKKNGKNPTILYGYGGFNISLTPYFSVSNATWLKNGGVYAVANLRGGGEYGKAWHDGGIQQKKKNVFHDFIAAAKYLQKENYATKDYMAIQGGSNGGLLVGATMTMEPNLVKVALPAVGVLDMLRYHTFTAGAGWAYDYGTAEDSKEMFDYLFSYSPVHNVKKGTCYPATLVTTGDHDDRVVPAHSFKFAAELQNNQSCENPTLIRIETRGGHGAGKSTEMIIEERTDIFAFALYNMGIKN